MTISGNYPQPVQVNGYTCRNCTDVDLAKKHIDPAHPKSGPFDLNAATDPTRNAVVKFGGALAETAKVAAADAAAAVTPYRPGQKLDLRT